MPVYASDKIKQFNNQDYKLMDAKDIEPSLKNQGSKSLEDDIKILAEKVSSGGTVHIGSEAPDNTEKIWIDTDDTSPDGLLQAVMPGENILKETYMDAIMSIKEKVEQVSYSLNKELEPGGFFIRKPDGTYMDKIDSSHNNPAEDSNYYPENPTPDDDIFLPPAGGNEEEQLYEVDKNIGVANVNTVRVKRGKKYNLPTLKDGEFGFCKDTNELFIGNDKSVVKIGSTGGGGSSSGNSGNLSGGHLDLQSSNGTDYRISISASGHLIVLPKKLYDKEEVKPNSAELTTDYKGLIINQIYGGGPVMGDITIDSSGMPTKTSPKGAVSHSFVELYNNSSTQKDLKLDGLSLQYKGPTGSWQVLPLKGVIPWRHSFLVRGLQHFPTGPDDVTRLRINRYDMQWNLAFNDNGFSVYLGAGTQALQVTNPSDIDGDGKRRQEGFIDLMGVGGENIQKGQITAYMGSYWQFMNNHTAALRVDNNDPYNSNIDENSNKDSVERVDYNTCNVEIYKPRCLADGEWDSYVNKLQLNPNAPSMINMSFGYDGDTSRSFNWHTLLTDQGYLYYRKQGTLKWEKVESNKRNVRHHDCESTIHSCTIYNLEPGATYDYKCGYDGHFSDQFFFEVTKFRKGAPVQADEKQNMKILWTSDQQSWTPYEYKAWDVSYKFIDTVEKDYDWMLNTGDISQNGTRPFEWRYYYHYADNTRYKPHEIVVGNNDLGGGAAKDDSTPITYYLTHDNQGTYEYNEKTHTINGCYSYNVGSVHFFCLNSNQKDIAHAGLETYEKLFKAQIAWLKKDLSKPENASKRWCIGTIHLSPVTCVRGKQQQLFLEVFQEFHVHFVLCGHNHTHSRSLPLKDLPIDTKIKLSEETTSAHFTDSSLPKEVQAIEGKEEFLAECKRRYVDEATGTVYFMCQATGYKLKGKEGQMKGAWWYDWKGPHPSAPSYWTVDITWDKVSTVSYKINNIVPTANDKAEFYVTPPIPVGPARYIGNPEFGGTQEHPAQVSRTLIDYADDTIHASEEARKECPYGRGSYNWRPWGRNFENDGTPKN